METQPPKSIARQFAAALAWFLALGGTYLVSIASDSGTELCYAIVFAAAGTIVVQMLHRADRRAFALEPRALLTLARRALAGALHDGWLLLGPRLFAQLRGVAPAGRYVRLSIDRGRGDAEGNGRVAAVLWVRAFTPNTIPLFVDGERLVLHQLVHRREPGSGEREFPA